MGGFFLSELSGECEACECNGRAELCAAGTGVCLVSVCEGRCMP